MYLELKRLDHLRASELPQVAAPFYAVGQLKSARAGYLRIRGFHEAWESCTDRHGPWDWNYKERGFERLCAEAGQGEWVLVLDKSWPPISPAFQQTDGQWQIARGVWEPAAIQRLTSHAQVMEREQREWEALQSRNLPASAPVVEPAVGPGNRAASLGPHVGADEKNSNSQNESTPPKYTNLQSMDPEYSGEETGSVWGTKVKYLNEAERQQYKLTIKDGRLFDNAGNPFDTSEANSVFAGGKGRAIFVMDEYGNIFASKTQSVGKFHHSSFLSGKPVAGAGELSVKNGYIDTITRRSGHYQPTQEHASQVLSQLRSNRIDVDAIKIEAGF